MVPAADMRELLIICRHLIDLWRGILSPAAGQRSKVGSRGSGSCYETVQLRGRFQIRISVCGYVAVRRMFRVCTLRIVSCQLLATVTCERPCVKVYSSDRGKTCGIISANLRLGEPASNKKRLRTR